MYNGLCLPFPYSCVYAFDKDEQRFLSLKAMITKSGSSCVKALLKDFLQVSQYMWWNKHNVKLHWYW